MPDPPGAFSGTITIILADDHPIVRSGLRMLLEAEEDQEDPAFAREALRAGARGYVLKQAAGADLVQAIRAIGTPRKLRIGGWPAGNPYERGCAVTSASRSGADSGSVPRVHRVRAAAARSAGGRPRRARRTESARAPRPKDR